MTNKKLSIILLTLFTLGIINVLILGSKEHSKEVVNIESKVFDGLEVDKYFELPVLEFEKYTEDELNAVLDVLKTNGADLQKALVIPIVTSIAIEDVTGGTVDFSTYARKVKIILDSTSHYIDEYSKFDTDNLTARQYHTALVLAVRQIHNGLVYYYSALVYDEEKDEYVVNEQMLNNGTEIIKKYYEYVGINEYIYDYIGAVNKDGLDEYINTTDKELEDLMEDIEEKIK